MIEPDQNNPEWFKENMEKIKCFKYAQDGVFDLTAVKNNDYDYTVLELDQ